MHRTTKVTIEVKEGGKSKRKDVSRKSVNHVLLPRFVRMRYEVRIEVCPRRPILASRTLIEYPCLAESAVTRW